MDHLLTCGEFAKLCHTSKDTLVWYQKKGLFEPVYVDERGYRYYDVLQYDTFLTIQQLSVAGLSLDAIKAYLSEKSVESMMNLYDEIDEMLERKISTLQSIQKRFTMMANALEAYVDRTCGSCFIEEKEETKIHVSECVTCMEDGVMARCMGDLIHRVGRVDLVSSLGMKMVDGCLYFYVYGDGEEVIPKGRFACVYHKGTYESVDESVAILREYVRLLGCECSDCVFVEMVVGDWIVDDASAYVMKVFVEL